MKNFVENLLKKGSLYRKELTVILTILLCFAASGICLPNARAQLLAKESVESQVSVPVLAENTSKKPSSELEKNVKDTDKSNKNDEEKDNKKDNDDKKEKDSDKNKDSKKDNEKASDTSTADSTSHDTASSTTSQTPAEYNSGNNASGSTAPSGGNTAPAAPATPAAPPEPEKVWVPPVYTTVHHEAVYETIQVVCCNYCGATFGSVGEFQVHKDANGG